jgi:hypothetical protein
VRTQFGDQQKRKNRALAGLTHTMNSPEAVATSKRLDAAIRAGVNWIK